MSQLLSHFRLQPSLPLCRKQPLYCFHAFFSRRSLCVCVCVGAGVLSAAGAVNPVGSSPEEQPRSRCRGAASFVLMDGVAPAESVQERPAVPLWELYVLGSEVDSHCL